MIKLNYIEEPSLQFGTNQHICPKAGIYSYSPYDINNVRPEKIIIGIIGKSDSIDSTLNWIESCKTHIEGKKSKNPHTNLFLNFCGFNKEIGFYSEISYDDSYIRKINNSEFNDILSKNNNLEQRIKDIAELYLNEIKFLSKNKSPNVILCVLSENFITNLIENESVLEGEDDSDVIPTDEETEALSKKEQNFRRYLKAKAMQYHIPIQIVRDRISNPTSDMQDPATIA